MGEALLGAKADTQRHLPAVLATILPRRLVDAWLSRPPALADRPLRELPDRALADLARRLHAWEVVPAGTEGYRKAEVTAGGVDTRELDSRTMASQRRPGLFFIGEVVDVTGWLGGYNFQWAWASGHAAGEAA